MDPLNDDEIRQIETYLETARKSLAAGVESITFDPDKQLITTRHHDGRKTSVTARSILTHVIAHR